MSIEHLTTALVAEAEAQIADIRERAHAEAAQLTTRDSAQRRVRLDTELAELRAACEAETDREVGATARRLRDEVLRERAHMLDRVRAALAERLPLLLADTTLVAAMVEGAMSVIGWRAAMIRCAPALVDEVRARSTAAVEVVADGSVGSGLVAALEGGRASVIVTLESELERRWPALQIEALAVATTEEPS